MKKLVFIAVLFFISAQPVWAHVLKTDNSIGAVIHVSPEDDPIAREITDFFFEFKDKNKQFKPENCDCKGTILRSGKEIYSAPLFQNSSNPNLENASFSFTFPERDIYKVQVSGKPTISGEFESFVLEWDIRVERETATAHTQNTTKPKQNELINWIFRHIPHLAGVFLILLFAIFYVIKQKAGKAKLKK